MSDLDVGKVILTMLCWISGFLLVYCLLLSAKVRRLKKGLTALQSRYLLHEKNRRRHSGEWVNL